MNHSVIDFLEKNGFEAMPDGYQNKFCKVYFLSGIYAVSDNHGYTMYSYNENIYWLIGVLTYYGFIKKNYK